MQCINDGSRMSINSAGGGWKSIAQLLAKLEETSKAQA